MALCLRQVLAAAIDRAGCGKRDQFGYSVIHLINQWSRGAELVAVELGKRGSSETREAGCVGGSSGASRQKSGVSPGGRMADKAMKRN